VVPGWASDSLDPRAFAWLSDLVRKTCGIELPPGKRTLLEGRLRRRLRALELGRFSEYVDLLQDPMARQQELQALVDAVATNQTAFYREPRQFQYLLEGAAARLGIEDGVPRPVRAWTAACSTGEEPYTLAMVLAEWGRRQPSRGFDILATDISLTALDRARRAVYRLADLAPLPAHWLARYAMRSRDRKHALARIVPELRARVTFDHANLIDPRDLPDGIFDVIFCRNVLIYFDLEQRRRILLRLCARLRAGGMLCLGHADNLNNMRLPLRVLEVNTYERLAEAKP
jgi:chemotaxis protein methyltransferase CheR